MESRDLPPACKLASAGNRLSSPVACVNEHGNGRSNFLGAVPKNLVTSWRLHLAWPLAHFAGKAADGAGTASVPAIGQLLSTGPRLGRRAEPEALRPHPTQHGRSHT